MNKAQIVLALTVSVSAGWPARASACPEPNKPASVIVSVEPKYPTSAREVGAVGTAQIKVFLDARGTVTDAVVSKSAGNGDLDEAALFAARKSTYSGEVTNCVGTTGSFLFQADFTGGDDEPQPTPINTATPLAWHSDGRTNFATPQPTTEAESKLARDTNARIYADKQRVHVLALRAVLKEYQQNIARDKREKADAKRQAAQDRSDQAQTSAYYRALGGDMGRIYRKFGEPCDTSAFRAAGYSNDTWWYCGSDGSYAKAFTFLNGALQSIYQP